MPPLETDLINILASTLMNIKQRVSAAYPARNRLPGIISVANERISNHWPLHHLIGNICILRGLIKIYILYASQHLKECSAGKFLFDSSSNILPTNESLHNINYLQPGYWNLLKFCIQSHAATLYCHNPTSTELNWVGFDMVITLHTHLPKLSFHHKQPQINI